MLSHMFIYECGTYQESVSLRTPTSRQVSGIDGSHRARGRLYTGRAHSLDSLTGAVQIVHLKHPRRALDPFEMKAKLGYFRAPDSPKLEQTWIC